MGHTAATTGESVHGQMIVINHLKRKQISAIQADNSREDAEFAGNSMLACPANPSIQGRMRPL
jgi:hypothetical protein